MTTPFDVDGYLRRIGYAGDHAPTLETLRAIHHRHAEAIAFENLDPLLRRPVRLDAASIQQKLVRGGRGGYCFEQNLLLRHALTALGFRTTGLAARILWNAPEGTVTARGHMLLLVHLEEGPHVADVGFGVLTLTAPLRLVPDAEQATPHETFRIIAAGGDFVMQAKLGGAWQSLYRFDLQPQYQADYEVTSWYLSNHPRSHFVTGLMAACPATDGRYTLRNNVLTVRYLDERTERRTLASAAELRAVLGDTFRLALPDAPELHAALEHLTATTA